MASGRIYHIGSIASIEGSRLRVRISQEDACSSCGARKLCPSAENRERLIDVVDDHPTDYVVGQEVAVYGETSMGRKAVWLAFGMPLLLTLVWIPAAVLLLQLPDVAAVGVLLLIYAIYFIVLHLMRDKLGSEFRLRIEKH